MADKITPEKRSLNMSKIKGTNTKIEILVRKYLFSKGFRYRKNVSTLPGKPDIVLPKYHTVIFVNGCFWHMHNGCKYAVIPKTRTDFWISKLKKNTENDYVATTKLESMGWNVIIVWECELEPDNFLDTMEKLIKKINANKCD